MFFNKCTPNQFFVVYAPKFKFELAPGVIYPSYASGTNISVCRVQLLGRCKNIRKYFSKVIIKICIFFTTPIISSLNVLYFRINVCVYGLLGAIFSRYATAYQHIHLYEVEEAL